METMSINERRTALYNDLATELDKLTSVLRKYTDSFSTEEIYSFSNAEKRIKQYKDRYSLLVAEMAPIYGRICECASAISVLLIEADRGADESVESLEMVFEEYSRFERVTASFSSETQQLLNDTEVMVSALMHRSERLLSAISAFKRHLS